MGYDYHAYLPKIRQWVQQHREEYIQDLTGIVNIKSVAVENADGYPFGAGPAKALDYALALGEKFGLTTENDDYYCGQAILTGKTNETISLVNHLDVVPEGSGWHYPPYQATLVGDELVGRGASDNKGPAIASLYALRCLKELGFELNHSISVLWGCQEEAGMKDMPHFLQTHADRLPKLFLVADCPFPIHYGEKGILEVTLTRKLNRDRISDFSGGVASNSVPDLAFVKLIGVDYADVRKQLSAENIEITANADGSVSVTAHGTAGHAAFPQNGTDNAIVKLAKALSATDILRGVEKEAISFLAQALDGYYGENLGIASQDDISGRTTAVGGYVRMTDGVLSQNINIRYAIKADSSQLIRHLTHSAQKSGFAVTQIHDNPPMYVPLDSWNGLPLKLAALSNELLDMGPLEPVILPGGTHARKLPNAIGYGPNLGPAQESTIRRLGRGHGIDESVFISAMQRAIVIYAATMLAIDEQI